MSAVITAMRQASAFLAEQFGIDLPKLARALRQLPRYLVDLQTFRRAYPGELSLRPCLHDRSAEAGNARGEYFVQDLYVARKIHAHRPSVHVDIGSRVDGFVAHVASFRSIEVWDIRPMPGPVQGIAFRQADVSDPGSLPRDYCDSMSCLHALEHFGLGRYGDCIDVRSGEQALHNMAAALQRGGLLHLSVPVGRERVLFNSHRIFDPERITAWARAGGLQLVGFTTVLRDDVLIEHSDWHEAFADIRQQSYCLGIFCFQRLAADQVNTAQLP